MNSEIQVVLRLISERINSANERRSRMIDYLLLKVEEQDWHGCADAAMDLRDIENQILALTELQEVW